MNKGKLLLWEVNTKLPEGTAVSVLLDNGETWHTKTRSMPWQLGHGQWVVALEGKAGGYALDRVKPIAEEGRS
jgi:hypothetical protein